MTPPRSLERVCGMPKVSGALPARRSLTRPQLSVNDAATDLSITWLGVARRAGHEAYPPDSRRVIYRDHLPGREGASSLPGASSRKNGTGAAGFACLSHIVQRRQCLQDSLDLSAARLDLEDQRTDRSRVGLRALEQVL